MLLLLALFVVLAVLGPFVGVDSRDGLDWTPNHFWLRRRSGPKLKMSDNREPASAGRGAADGCRTAPAAG
jgi:hypothetical protein